MRNLRRKSSPSFFATSSLNFVDDFSTYRTSQPLFAFLPQRVSRFVFQMKKFEIRFHQQESSGCVGAAATLCQLLALSLDSTFGRYVRSYTRNGGEAEQSEPLTVNGEKIPYTMKWRNTASMSDGQQRTTPWTFSTSLKKQWADRILTFLSSTIHPVTEALDPVQRTICFIPAPSPMLAHE